MKTSTKLGILVALLAVSYGYADNAKRADLTKPLGINSQNKSLSLAGYSKDDYERLIKKRFLGNVSPTDGITPGTGYSKDTLSIAPVACYKPINITRSGQSAIVDFSLFKDVNQIASIFGVNANFSAGIGFFAADGLISYLNQLNENVYSLSINYYEKVSDSLIMQYSYNPETILTSVGKGIYSGGKNSVFRLFCGDTLITSYDEGAGLIMSIKISFNDKTQKQIFASQFSAGISNFLAASAEIAKVANNYGLHGNIKISAFQMGGNPEELSKILSSSIVSCDLTNVEACRNTAIGLIYYAKEIFPKQFTQKNGIWSSPLVPLGGFKTDYQVSDFGLKLAPTYVTPEVVSAREKISSAYKLNKYYVDNIYSILNSYVAPLDLAYRHKVEAVYDMVVKNVYLFDGTPAGDKALDCWGVPFRCKEVADQLISLLSPIDFGQMFNDVTGPILHNLHEEWLGTTFWGNGGIAGVLSIFPDFPDNSHWHITSAQMKLIPTAEGSSWQIDGTYYDAGNCPKDGNTFTIKPKWSIGYSPAIMTLNYFGSGGCPSGSTTREIKIDLLDNPYAFDIVK